MSLVIRLRQPADMEELAAMLGLVHEVDRYPARAVEDAAGWLSGERVRAALVATEGGKVLGHVSLASVEGDRAAGLWRESVAPDEELVVVKRLFVDPGRRGERLGSRLLEAAVALAHRQGARPVLDVDVKAKAANRLYEQAGFVPVGDLELTWSGMSEPFTARCYVGPPPPVARGSAG